MDNIREGRENKGVRKGMSGQSNEGGEEGGRKAR